MYISKKDQMERALEIMRHQRMVLCLHHMESKLSYNIISEKMFMMWIHIELKNGEI